MSIKGFQDLEVYKESYHMVVKIHQNLLPFLPRKERWDLVNQLRRSTKAIPALIAEGYAKKNQINNFRKYLNDALGEVNEVIVHLSLCRDLYRSLSNKIPFSSFIISYEQIGKKLYRLSLNWKHFSE